VGYGSYAGFARDSRTIASFGDRSTLPHVARRRSRRKNRSPRRQPWVTGGAIL
jgi:hypothetical protein